MFSAVRMNGYVYGMKPSPAAPSSSASRVDGSNADGSISDEVAYLKLRHQHALEQAAMQPGPGSSFALDM